MLVYLVLVHSPLTERPSVSPPICIPSCNTPSNIYFIPYTQLGSVTNVLPSLPLPLFSTRLIHPLLHPAAHYLLPIATPTTREGKIREGIGIKLNSDDLSNKLLFFRSSFSDKCLQSSYLCQRDR